MNISSKPWIAKVIQKEQEMEKHSDHIARGKLILVVFTDIVDGKYTQNAFELLRTKVSLEMREHLAKSSEYATEYLLNFQRSRRFHLTCFRNLLKEVSVVCLLQILDPLKIA